MIRQILFLAIFLLAGCRGGYVSPQAVTRLEFASVSETDAALLTIQNALQARGFELQSNEPLPEEMNLPPALRWRDQHQVSLALKQNGGEDLVAYLTPFPSAETFFDAPAQRHFPVLEVRLVELRPGGFSPEGHRAYAELSNFLRQQGYQAVVISEPPPTNDEEHARIRFEMMATFGMLWLVAWALGAATVGTLANWLARRMRATRAFRRVAFVVVCVVLVTPLPYPAALAVLPFPGVLWLLSDVTTYAKFMSLWAFSGVVSGALGVVAAVLLIRDGKKARPAEVLRRDGSP